MPSQESSSDFTDLDRMLHVARGKAQSWIAEGQAIAERLTAVRDTAAELLAQLPATNGNGHHAAAMLPGVKVETAIRPRGTRTKKKRTMSAAARKAISKAQRKRWRRLRLRTN